LNLNFISLSEYVRCIGTNKENNFIESAYNFKLIHYLEKTSGRKNMQTIDIIREIQGLPLDKKFFVVEELIKAIKMEDISYKMESAAKELLTDYTIDKELTAFTALDFEDFYEAK